MHRKDTGTKTLGRRQLLKILSATGGAVASTLLPDAWVKPVVKVGLLPAHAATSPKPLFGPKDSLGVKATWTDNDNNADIDLIVVEPDGTVVHPVWGVISGTTAIHSGDVSWGTGPELVIVPADAAVPGTYELYLVNDESNPVSVTVAVVTEQGTATFDRMLTGFPSHDDTAHVANVNFPGGSSFEKTGPILPGIIPGLPRILNPLRQDSKSRKKYRLIGNSE